MKVKLEGSKITMSSDEMFDGLHALTKAAMSRARENHIMKAGEGAPGFTAAHYRVDTAARVEGDTTTPPQTSSAPTTPQLNSFIDQKTPPPLECLTPTKTPPQILHDSADYKKVSFQAVYPDAKLISPPQEISRAFKLENSISEIGPPPLLPPYLDDKKHEAPEKPDNLHVFDRVPRSPGQPIKPTAGPKPSFVLTLMRLLTNDCHNDIIYFLPDQKHFVVVDTVKFASDVLPVYFGVKSYSSFKLKLMRWGFECLREKMRGTRRVVNIFYHPQFAQNNWDECREIGCLGALAKRPARQDPLPRSLIADSERSLVSISAGDGSANDFPHASEPLVGMVKPVPFRLNKRFTTSITPTQRRAAAMPLNDAMMTIVAVNRGILTRGDPLALNTSVTSARNMDQQHLRRLHREVQQLRQLNEMTKAKIAALRMKRQEITQQQQPSLLRLPYRNLHPLGPFDSTVT